MTHKILVTGASGFIASNCIIDLLNHGYEVRGTIRNLDRADKLREILSKHHEAAAELELSQATLTSPDGWLKAMQGCSGIFHIASPVPVIQPKDASEIIEPARQGTLNVLHAAREAGIPKVVLTSSVAAVQGAEKVSERTYTDKDWSDIKDPKLSAYAASKTIAEKAAWNFVEDGGPELATVNPALVLGPALEADYGSSLEALVKLFSGEVPLIPRFGFEIVDVRDVATLHRLAFEATDSAGQRFLCGAGFRWFREIAAVLREEFPDHKKIPKKDLPNFLAGFFALFIKEFKQFVNDLDAVKRLDCSPAIDLGWNPRSPEEAIIAGAKSLVDLGVV